MEEVHVSIVNICVLLPETQVYEYTKNSRILPVECLNDKVGNHKSDVEIVQLLIVCLQQSMNDRLELMSTIDKLEEYLLSEYNDIYQEVPQDIQRNI